MTDKIYLFTDFQLILMNNGILLRKYLQKLIPTKRKNPENFTEINYLILFLTIRIRLHSRKKTLFLTVMTNFHLTVIDKYQTLINS